MLMKACGIFGAMLLMTGLCSSLPAQTGTNITIHVTALIDSTHPAAQYAGTVKTAVTAGTLQIPAGAPAAMKLVLINNNPRTWSVALTAINVNGSNVAVAGNSPSLSGYAGLSSPNTTANVSQVSQALGGLLGGRTKPAAASKPTANAVPSVTGARVYVPAMSDVSFVVPQTAAAAAPAVTPASSTTAAAQQSPPSAAAPGAPGAAVAPAPAVANTTPAGSAPPSSAVVQYEGLQYQLVSCKREAPHIICEIQITNQRGTDAKINGGQGTHFFDQFGNKVMASEVKVANCPPWGGCELLPNVPVVDHIEFVDADGRATKLLRLQVWLYRKAVAQFTEIPIQ